MGQGMSPDEASLELDDEGNPADEAAPPDPDAPLFVDVNAPAPAPAAAPAPAPAPEPGADPADEPPALAPAPAPAPEPAEPPPAPPAPPPAPAPVLASDEIAAIEAKRAELRAKEIEVDKKWGAGQLSDEERANQLADLRDERDALGRAQTHVERAQIDERKSQEAVIEGIIESARGVIDYTKPAAAAAFDATMSAIRADPANARLSFKAQADKAHAEVLASFGLAKPAAPAPAPAPAPKPAAQVYAERAAAAVDKGDLPPTLSRVPAAAEANVQGDEFSHINSLSGIDRERAVAKLTPEQMDRYLG